MSKKIEIIRYDNGSLWHKGTGKVTNDRLLKLFSLKKPFKITNKSGKDVTNQALLPFLKWLVLKYDFDIYGFLSSKKGVKWKK